MPDVQTPETTQTQTETTAPATVDYQKQYEELNSKYSELEKTYKEDQSAMQLLEGYLQKDEVAASRARVYLQATKEGKDFNEMLKAMEIPGTKAKTQKEEAPQQPQFDPKKIEEIVNSRLQSSLDPIREKAAEMDVERSKTQIFKDNPWMNEDSYKEFEKRFGEQVDALAQKAYQNMGPFMTRQDAQRALEQAKAFAYSKYEHLTDSQLVNFFMQNERDKWIAEGRRVSPKLPNGMVDNLPTGKSPQLVDQLRKAYRAVEGNTTKVGKLFEEYGPQLGIQNETQFFKLVEGE